VPILKILNLQNYVFEDIVTCLLTKHGVWIGNWIYSTLIIVVNRTGTSIKGEENLVNRKAYENLTKI
jgi:hypothetical protein